MSPKARKIVIPLLIAMMAISLFVVMFLLDQRPDRHQRFGREEPQTDAPETTARPDATPTQPRPTTPDAEREPPSAEPPDEVDEADLRELLSGLHAVAPDGPTVDPVPLGSFDWRVHTYRVEFAPIGAGIERMALADSWQTARARREAERIKREVERGDISLAEALDELPDEDRYIIQETRDFRHWDSGQGRFVIYRMPAFAARSIRVVGPEGRDGHDGSWVNLFRTVWSQDPDDPGRWVSEVRNDRDHPILRIVRHYRFGSGRFDLVIDQTFENLSNQPITIELRQYGPADLEMDRGAYYDRRRMRIGHVGDLRRGASPRIVYADTDFLFERTDVIKRANPQEVRNLWPNDESLANEYALSWFATSNRYFTVAIHPDFDPETARSVAIGDVVSVIRPFYDGEKRAGGNDNIVFELDSAPVAVGPGETISLDYSVYAGPLDRHILNREEPYASLNLGYLILYQMSTWACCGMCTFQWLAHLLLNFLGLVHAVLGDWGVAIIVLVVVVRLLLHPITKKSQVSIQRFQKAMQKMGPEIQKLREKYKSDPKRMQQEQMRLYREHNVNPAQILGCLPMFLQMPIWIALYAMLYFAWDLRHEPAFWGVFQLFAGWPFLADLSGQDHFFWEFEHGIRIPFYWAPITGINLLPFLMGFIFYFQQKYMTPQSTMTMTKEQQQTQKIMKVMMVVMFPIMLYSAPSGLNLYIITSSVWGILEMQHIRRHIDTLDLEAPKKKADAEKKKKKKSRNIWQRAQEEAAARAEQRKKEKKRGPEKRYKRRRD